MRFSVDTLDEWVQLTGINAITNQQHKFVSLSYVPLAERSHELKDYGITIKIDFDYSLPSSDTLTEAKIEQKAYIEIESSIERPFYEIREIAEKITAFLAFAIDGSVSIRDVTIITDQQIETKMIPVSIKCFYASTSYTEKVIKADRESMLFMYPGIRDQLGEIIQKWLLNYELVEPAMYLYFSFKRDGHKFLEGKFLALAQGLETYDRRKSPQTLRNQDQFDALKKSLLDVCPENEKSWLENMLAHGNEVNLRKRFKNIVDPFKKLIGNSKKREEIIGKIYNTRNYLTHYPEEAEPVVVLGKELWVLCCQMEGLFKLNFLKDLGFSDDQIKEIFENRISKSMNYRIG